MARRTFTIVCAFLFVAHVAVADEPVTKASSQPKHPAGGENLKRLGLAFHGYHDLFGHFPPAVIYSANGKVAHSWRVELLPVLRHYVDRVDPDTDLSDRAKYDAAIRACGYDIDQPWDSKQNRAILNAMPSAYRHPSDDPNSNQSAFYAIVGVGTAFDPKHASRYMDIRAWPSTTLMLAESRSREPWTRPVDIAYSANTVVPRFGGFSPGGFMTVSCDGAVHFVSDATSPADIRSYITKDQSDRFSIQGIPAVY